MRVRHARSVLPADRSPVGGATHGTGASQVANGRRGFRPLDGAGAGAGARAGAGAAAGTRTVIGPPLEDGAPDEGSGPPGAGAPRRSSRRVRAGLVLGALVVLGLVAALVVTNLRISSRPALSTGQVSQIASKQVSSAISQIESAPPVGETVYQGVEAGLVVVQAQRAAAAGGDDLGSGVVIDSAGDILTALHVVQAASAIEVTFADGTVSPATVGGTEPNDDIAELVPSRLPSVMQPLVLGSGPQVGDEAFVVGNPLGLAGSLSAGVISGLDRTFAPGSGRTLSGMIQFDAAVNPGSSGGPLLNTKGQVIGIVVGLANPSRSDAFAGIGFAVPIATAGGAAGAPAK